MKILKTIL